MTGLKTNERPGTRARVSHVRSSAYKAREILDLIRGKSYGEATEILAFSERSISETIAKVLDSAVANAEHNDGLDAEELYVAACYADEGPTLKRWRPRARGRATRIRKRTCHITVIVARYDDEQLDILRAREANRGRSGSAQASEARRQRVARSRARSEEHDHDHDEAEESVEETGDAVDDLVEETGDAVDDLVEESGDAAEEAVEESGDAAEEAVEETGDAAEEAVEESGDAVDEIEDAAEDTAREDEDTPPFEGSVTAPADGSIPDGYPVKGNLDSMKFHEPGGRWYDNTVAELFFATAEDAEAAGFTKAGSRKKKDD